MISNNNKIDRVFGIATVVPVNEINIRNKLPNAFLRFFDFFG